MLPSSLSTKKMISSLSTTTKNRTPLIALKFYEKWLKMISRAIFAPARSGSVSSLYKLEIKFLWFSKNAPIFALNKKNPHITLYKKKNRTPLIALKFYQKWLKMISRAIFAPARSESVTSLYKLEIIFLWFSKNATALRSLQKNPIFTLYKKKIRVSLIGVKFSQKLLKTLSSAIFTPARSDSV